VVKTKERVDLLRRISRVGHLEPVTKIGSSIMSLNTSIHSIRQFVEMGLVRTNKQKNRTFTELTQKGKLVVMSDNPEEELKRYISC